MHGYIFPRNKVVEPPGEAQSDQQILNDIGKKLGFSEYFWDDYEDSLDYILEPAGFKWKDFKEVPWLRTMPEYRKHERYGFASASGKLDFYLEQYEAWGYDPLPDYTEPPESPKSDPAFTARYPLILITGIRVFNFFNSEHRQSETLLRGHPDPLLEIHPETAKELHIEDGKWVFVESPRGRVKFKAKLFDGIHPRVVATEFGWCFPERGAPDYGWSESNINILTMDGPPLDSGMGATNLKGLMCRVFPAA